MTLNFIFYCQFKKQTPHVRNVLPLGLLSLRIKATDIDKVLGHTIPLLLYQVKIFFLVLFTVFYCKYK